MNPEYFRPLEFDKIRARLAAHTAFRASEQLALDLLPSTDLAAIKAWQKETTEARALLDQQPASGIGGARDVRALTRAARIGACLTPPDFLDLRAMLLAARALRRTLLKLEPLYPRLAFIAGGLDDLPALVDAIGRVLNDRGQVVDDASPALARIRHELNVSQARLMERLQRMIASGEIARWLQEPIVTQREGRYVIPIRAEARGRVKGIVHDSSASGATLFVEPLALVELGNRVRELTVEETREVERILRELTSRVAAAADEIDRTVETLAQLDLAFAKAKYSAEMRAVEPTLAPNVAGSGLQLDNARHPLLDPAKVVPISIELGRTPAPASSAALASGEPEFSILIITGPNTGGKTVTLKTVGLLALMAQSGLHIPADAGSQLPVYNGIFADIGDEQSIEQSLSTFSGHLTNIVEILREATPQSLVLLDELGAGTDPVEGAALARAIITHLLQRKISALVATHYAELKAFAHATSGVENASVEFDVETLAPTYRLTIGLPGRSNAFAIATRLGLDPALVEQARANLARRDVELETMLAEIKRAQAETARELSRAEAARAAAERARVEARRKVAASEQARAEILKQARAEADAEWQAARAELNRLKQEWRRVALTREHIERAEEDLETVRALTHPAPAAETAPAQIALLESEPIEVGDQVYVPNLDQAGQVSAVSADGVDVQMGAFRAHLAWGQVELRFKARPASVIPRSELNLPAADSPGIEIHLRGLRAEEALEQLDKYLDRAYRAGLPYVRVVHGKGTGTLRRLVREQLEHNPLVVSFQTAEGHAGGEGVTVAQLASR